MNFFDISSNRHSTRIAQHPGGTSSTGSIIYGGNTTTNQVDEVKQVKKTVDNSVTPVVAAKVVKNDENAPVNNSTPPSAITKVVKNDKNVQVINNTPQRAGISNKNRRHHNDIHSRRSTRVNQAPGGDIVLVIYFLVITIQLHQYVKNNLKNAFQESAKKDKNIRPKSSKKLFATKKNVNITSSIFPTDKLVDVPKASHNKKHYINPIVPDASCIDSICNNRQAARPRTSIRVKQPAGGKSTFSLY